MSELKFTYEVNGLVLVERYLGRKFADIIAEMRSESGLSLNTLRALVAANSGTVTFGGASYWSSPHVSADIAYAEYEQRRLGRAGVTIAEHGIQKTAEAVGAGLRAFLARMEMVDG